MDSRRKSTTYLNNKENKENRKLRSKSLGGSGGNHGDGSGDDHQESDSDAELTPTKLARRKAKPRRSILKPQPPPDSDEEEELPQNPVKHATPRKSEASRRVSFASHCFIRLFEDEEGNKQASSSPRRSPSPKKSQHHPQDHHPQENQDSDTSDMSMATQDVTHAFKKAFERKRPLDGSDTESDDGPTQDANDAEDNTMQMDLTEAVGHVFSKSDDNKSPKNSPNKSPKSPKSPQKLPKKVISHSPTRKSPRLSSQSNKSSPIPLKAAEPVALPPQPPMQLPQFTLSPTASEKNDNDGNTNVDNNEDNEKNTSSSSSEDEADTTMDFTVSMSQAGVPKLPHFETGRRRSSLDRRSSVIKQNSGSPEGSRSISGRVDNSSSSSSDDEEADQHMLMQPPPPEPAPMQHHLGNGSDSDNDSDSNSSKSNSNDDMDLTKAAITHIDRNDSAAHKIADGSMTMEMTQAVGGMLGGERREEDDHEENGEKANNHHHDNNSVADMSLASNTTHNNESMAMEMTGAVGGLMEAEKSVNETKNHINESDSGSSEDDQENESMAMEMTGAVGGLMEAEKGAKNDSSDEAAEEHDQESANDGKSTADMSLISNPAQNESMTMEMTQAVGGPMNVPTIPEENDSSDSSDSDDNADATMTMEITKPIGKGILVNDETRRLRKSLGPRVSRVSFAPSVKASPLKAGAGPRPSLKSALKSSTSFTPAPAPAPAPSPKKASISISSPDAESKGGKRSSFAAPTQSSLMKKETKSVRHSLGGALGGAGTSSPLRSALKNAAKSPNKKRASFAGEVRQDDGEEEKKEQDNDLEWEKNYEHKQQQEHQINTEKLMSPLVQRLQLASPLRPSPLKLDVAAEKGDEKEKLTHKPRRRSSLALSTQALEATPDTLATEKEQEEQSKNDREREYEREAEEERVKEEQRRREAEQGRNTTTESDAMDMDKTAPEQEQSGTPTRRRSLHAQQMTPSKLRRSISASNAGSPMSTPKRQSLRLASSVTTPQKEAFANTHEPSPQPEAAPSPPPAPPIRNEFAAGPETERMIEGLMQEEEQEDNGESSVEAPVQISLNDFLELTDMKFLDGISTIKRRSTVGPGGLSGENAPMHEPSSLEYLRAHAVTGPKLEMMYWCCHELKRYISEGIEALNSYEREVDNENPPVIVDYLLASEDMRVRIEAQLKIVKNSSRLNAKRVWYGWRKELVSGHAESLNESFNGLEKDARVLQETRGALGENLPQLHALKDKLETELRRERDIVRDIASCDKEEVEGLREAIAEQAQPLELYKAEIASNNEELARLRARLEAKQETLAQNTHTIDSNRKEWDMVRCLTKAEAMKRKREYESLQILHSWQIVHLSQSTQKFNYANELALSISQQGVEMDLLPPKKGELRPLLEYLLDCLRGQLTEEGISQDTQLSYTLQRISTIWINVKHVHAQFKRLAQVYKLSFNVSIEGDLVVTLAIVFRSQMRKLNFEIVVGSDMLVDFDRALKKAKVKTEVVAGDGVDTESITHELLKQFGGNDGILEAFEAITI
ncbi:hypothetical protein E3P81_03233 [Wallemia ichthyophaga]|nr:hypothetical protein E3P97_02371 [Wallemia ichthyophaga]TIB29771.1 hypothetical protein E3P85_02990 [Wallemia ichthyophaga]TIB44898.1 hypothetical protein E3P82_03238 [Wallemia ichthyophaga]TIB47536.1 hypothetical protein E3P81_03233 [Wallemia ichthyophaga]TIB50741.1 hypothetical protein E3P80_03242 [Wallemia ichthyophaga]